MSGEVDGSHIYAIENNHGGVDALGVDFGAGIQDALYKGSLVVGSSQATLNCDYGDYYPTMTFSPSGPPVLDSFTVTGAAGDYKYMVLNNAFDHSIIPGLDITNYAFGFWVPGSANQCPEYVIKEIVNIHNNTDDTIVVKVAKWKDFDISAGGTGDLADFNQPYQSIWMWDDAVPANVFGETEVPHVVGDIPMTGYAISQAARVYDGQYMDSLYEWMDTLGWGVDNPGTPEDKSIFIAEIIIIPPHSMVIKEFLEWGYLGPIAAGGDNAWKTNLYCILHFAGYYRGDVNVDGKYNTSDVIYMINYLFKGGPKPIEFVDQMDVNNDHNTNVADVIYSINYLFKGGPPAIDEDRPLWYWPGADALHKTQAKRVPGLFGDANWKNLGQ